jgi:hypothetical protein
MSQGMRTVLLATVASCTLSTACRKAPDPAQLTAVDQLISATDAALLTLNELDRGRYQRSDSLYHMQAGLFRGRFADTLAPAEAKMLGDQYITLRAADHMGDDHERILADIATSTERLRALRSDLAAGAIDQEDGTSLITAEQRRHIELIEGVHGIIDNYRMLQKAWDRRDSVALLLSDSLIRAPR